jgi:hypothetical protein
LTFTLFKSKIALGARQKSAAMLGDIPGEAAAGSRRGVGWAARFVTPGVSWSVIQEKTTRLAVMPIERCQLFTEPNPPESSSTLAAKR